MKHLSILFLVVPGLAGSAFATVQPARNAHEAAVDNRQIVTDRAWRERDAAEVAEFERLVASLADANRDRMGGRYRETSALVRSAMEREIEQARTKRAQAAVEQGQSRREARGERMEAGMTGSPRDHVQAIDDRHDLRDDRRDRRAQADLCDAMKRVGDLSASLQNDIANGSRPAMDKNLALAKDFLSLMREDLAATSTEIHEDKVERREDRRERRTDRR